MSQPKDSKFFIFLLIAFLPAGALNAQCTLAVDAGPDLKICSSEIRTLEASVAGSILFINWSPTEGLSNPFSIRPTISNPLDTVYQLKVLGYNEAENLLANGNFSGGNEGFSSQYEFGSTGPGGFIIGKLGTELFPDAKPCEDHSQGDDNMMMIRISNTENLDIWCQEVDLIPDQDYHFIAYATGLQTNNPPIIVLKINDEPISVGTLGSFACSWQKVIGDWNSGSESKAKICLTVADEDIGAGTDFVLDDIGFYPVCEKTDEVKVERIPFEIAFEKNELTIACKDSILLEPAVNAAPGNLGFQWSSSDGLILSGAQNSSSWVGREGIYTLTASLDAGDQTCETSASVKLTEIISEDLLIKPPLTLNCNQEELRLELEGIPLFEDFEFQWSTDNGSISSDPTLKTITVDAAGLYQVDIQTINGNCKSMLSVEVREEKLQFFSYDLSSPNCETGQVDLVFDQVLGGLAPFRFSVDGGINFQSERFSPGLEGRNYELVVEDSNGCQLREELSIPLYQPIELELMELISVPSDSSFQMPVQTNLADSLIAEIRWTPGIALSCTDCLTPMVRPVQNQLYQIELTAINGCRATASIRILIQESEAVYFPNAFSPNGDGQNDRYLIFGNPNSVKNIELFQLFNRYGQLVFERKNFTPNDENASWDGKHRGQLLNSNIFIYTSLIEMANGDKKRFTGTLVLVR